VVPCRMGPGWAGKTTGTRAETQAPNMLPKSWLGCVQLVMVLHQDAAAYDGHCIRISCLPCWMSPGASLSSHSPHGSRLHHTARHREQCQACRQTPAACGQHCPSNADCLFWCCMCRQVNQAQQQGSVGDYLAAWSIKRAADPDVMSIT
jgi:hypothetical protein